MRRTLVLPIVLLAGCLLFGLWSLAAQAEPYLAVRTGLKCSTCHSNGTGGGKRNEFGLIYSRTSLPMRGVIKTPEGSMLDARLSESISVGADFRATNLTTFEYTSSEGETAETENRSSVTKADLYVEVDLIPERFTLYVDQILHPTGTNRELFGMLRDDDLEYFVKIGRMLLPYGFRLIDDEAFIRNRTGYTYNRHDLAAEVGVEPGFFSGVVNITDNQLSTRASVVFRRFRIGGSYGRSTERGDRYTYGGFGGATFGKFSLLGEGNFITEGDIDRFAGLAEVNFLPVRGFNVKATYEFFDRNRDVPNDRDGQDRFTFGVEPFLAPFLQVSAFYRINNFIPQNVTDNQNQLLLQFHAFF